MMKRHRHGWLVAALVVIAATAVRGDSGETGVIRIWPTAVVSEDTVTLADVADVSGCGADLQPRLASIELRPAPSAGGETLISSGEIRAALSQAEINLASVSLLGSANCRVSKPRIPRVPRKANPPPPPPSIPPTTTAQRSDGARHESRESKSADRPVLPGTLEAVFRDYIAARSPDPGAKLDIRFNSACLPVLKLGTTEREFRIRPGSERRLGFLSFSVEIVEPDQSVRVEPIVAEALLVKEVVVARRAINRGEVIEGRALRLEERRFSALEAVGLTDLAAATGQQCADFVRPGDMLRPELLKSKPLVNRGDIVTIWARVGGVEIKTTGKAQDAGALGDQISVRRDGAKRQQDVIEAMVTGLKTVTLSDTRQLAGR